VPRLGYWTYGDFRKSREFAERLSPRCHSEARKVVGATGFEPATPCAQGRCATRLRYAPTRQLSHTTELAGLGLRASPRRQRLSKGRQVGSLPLRHVLVAVSPCAIDRCVDQLTE
jgi:hypothetical protein